MREPVRDVLLEDLADLAPLAGRLVRLYEEMGGFSSRYIAEAFEVLRSMAVDDCTVFLAFTANLVATGLRGILASITRTGLVDVIITTGGAIDHDIARSLGGTYYRGRFEMDDCMLREMNIHRLGNVLVPSESYGPVIESFTHDLLQDLARIKRRWTPSELLREVGLRLKDDRGSILAAAASVEIPVFSPGVLDSAFGTAIFTFNESGRSTGLSVELDLVGDMGKLADIVFESRKLGAIVLGGGISKHHVIWWAQFKGGLDYAVYITTAVEFDGSLSGARTREAISWGKLKASAQHVTVPADATVVFPIIALALYGELSGRPS